MRVYFQLTQGQRYQIEALVKTGHNQTMIAKVLTVNKSTISRELKRNRGLRGYRPKQAHEKSMIRQHKKLQSRKYLPKSRRLDNVTQQQLIHIMSQLNHRPRKSLGYKTPYELFFKKKTLLTVALTA